jgi:hypothetical protein
MLLTPSMMTRKFLLSCGIVSSIFYIGMNVFVPSLFDGYDPASQTVSELSAIDAPSRLLWVLLAMIYILLFAAFGWGVWQAGATIQKLRRVGSLIFVYAVINIYWPPMHLRGNDPTWTDTLHIVWAMMTLLLMMLIMGFAAAALGKLFRIYTVATFVVFIVFGVLVGIEAPGIPDNLPTPHIGIWERINIAAFMVWIVVLAAALLYREKKSVVI